MSYVLYEDAGCGVRRMRGMGVLLYILSLYGIGGGYDWDYVRIENIYGRMNEGNGSISIH
jgi:hypothetical protein